MLGWFFAGLFLVAQFGRQSNGMAVDPLFVCRAWGDPHLETWRLHGTALTASQKQDCFTNGAYDLVKNAHVQFSIQTNARFIVQSTLSFFNAPSTTPFCTIHTENSGIVPGNVQACNSNGVTWSSNPSGHQYTLTLEYKQGQAHFKATVQYVNSTHNSHFNIHVWQPESWVAGSSGFCTQGDLTCSKTRTSDLVVADSLKQPLTFTQAYDICQTYVNAYLSNSAKRSDLLKNTVDNVMNGCVADVMFTEDVEVARSGLSVLMMEELTGGETSFDGLRTAIDSGITVGNLKVQGAAQEAQMKVARFL